MILHEIVCFHLVFSFCVDLVGMVKIMQKHAKLEQKWKKTENQEISRNSRLDVMPSRLHGADTGLKLGNSLTQSTRLRRKSTALVPTRDEFRRIITGSRLCWRNSRLDRCKQQPSAHQPSPARAMRDEQCTKGWNSRLCFSQSTASMEIKNSNINPSRRQREKPSSDAIRP